MWCWDTDYETWSEKLRAAAVERREIGGRCVLRGSAEQRVFVRTAEAVDEIRSLDGKQAMDTASGTDDSFRLWTPFPNSR